MDQALWLFQRVGARGAKRASTWMTAMQPQVMAKAVAFAGMSAMLIAIGVLASYVPARRASSVDPIEALRTD